MIIEMCKQLVQDPRAVSKPVGVILMIAVVVALAAIAAIFLLGLGEGLNNPAPNVVLDFDVNDDGNNPELVIRHELGETITSSNTEKVDVILVDVGHVPWAGHMSEPHPPWYVDLNRESFNAGNEISTPITPDANTPSPGDTILVRWESPGGTSSAILGEYTIPGGTGGAPAPGFNTVSCTVDGDARTVEYTGSGTEANPFQVTNITELQCMGDAPVHYELVNDIDASETASWNGGDGFDPVHLYESFDGNGHEITELTINREGTDSIGMFSRATGTVSNVHMVNSDVTGGDDTGILAGRVEGSINDVTVSGTVTGDSEVGGIAGTVNADIVSSTSTATVSGDRVVGGLAGSVGGTATVTDSSATGTVSSNSEIAGGLVGNLNGDVIGSHATGDVTGNGEATGGLIGSTSDNTVVTESYATGAVTGEINVGGLIGDATDGEITVAYATGDVTGERGVGGTIGSTHTITGDGTTVRDVYATGDVTGDETVGGFVGSITVTGPSGYSDISTSYATGAVTGDDNVGGFTGQNAFGNSDVTDSYWDADSTGITAAEDEGGEGEALSTSEMTGSAAASNMDGFDFTSVWETVTGPDDYPELRALQ